MSPKILKKQTKMKFSISLFVSRRSVGSEPFLPGSWWMFRTQNQLQAVTSTWCLTYVWLNVNNQIQPSLPPSVKMHTIAMRPLRKVQETPFQKIKSATLLVQHVRGLLDSSTYVLEKGVLLLKLIVGRPV